MRRSSPRLGLLLFEIAGEVQRHFSADIDADDSTSHNVIPRIRKFAGPVEIVRRGAAGNPSFFVRLAYSQSANAARPHLHLAFTAENRQQVEAFYRAALEAGGKDNGAPGLRPHYHANYDAAFVIDPDGHSIDVVCHEPEA